MEETQRPQEQGPLPRSSEAVDWWLTIWNRQAVVDGQEPLTRKDVERLIEVNGGTAEDLDLVRRDMRRADLGWVDLQGAFLMVANLQGAYLGDANLQGANLWEADLQGADLWGADLQGAILVGANLRGAFLRAVKLQGALLAGASISPDTDLEGVEWDPKYISVHERDGNYEGASAVYRRLKEWYRGAGMLTIAGELHYREREASRKAKGQRLGRQFKEGLAAAWRRLKAGDVSAPTKE